MKHYRTLLFYAFNRFKGNNYRRMREYLADVLISEVEEFMPLWKKKVLDVGGARGEFCRILNKKRKCNAINIDPEPAGYIGGWDKKLQEDVLWPKTKVGVADKLPFRDNSFDLVICRGVLEHIPTDKQQKSVQEMYRVTKRKGFCYIMIPPWYNPHAGHTLKPFHVIPFKAAKFLRQTFFGTKIKARSLEEEYLYPVTFSRMRKMILNAHFRIAATRDTHLRFHFVTKIPVLREIAVPAVSFILKKE
jgi:ubiquinone/menaquinone biosynthesis C-methylase UbiE